MGVKISDMTLLKALASGDGFEIYDASATTSDLRTSVPYLFLNAGVVNAETLAATKALSDGDDYVQNLDPGGADRDVTLPAEATSNHGFVIRNTADADEWLLVKNDGGTIIIEIPQDGAAALSSDGTTWRVVAHNNADIGASFPSTPATDQRFFRNDLGLLCYYDGTRWLTEEEYTANYANAATASGSGGGFIFDPIRGDHAPYIVRVTAIYRVVTTNDGSNYWTIAVRGVTTTVSASTTIHSWDTSAISPDVYTKTDAAATTANPANNSRFQLLLTETGTAGTIQIGVTIYYKLIVT